MKREKSLFEPFQNRHKEIEFISWLDLILICPSTYLFQFLISLQPSSVHYEL